MENNLTIRFPDPPAEYSEKFSLSRLKKLMKNFGPAAIVASISIGAGESVLAVRVGAWAGYSLMWIVPLAALTKAGIITYLLGRYTVLSGELISERIAKAPGPRYWSVIFILTISLFMAPFFISAVAGSCGGLLHTLTSIGTPVIWSIVFILLSTTFGALGSFDNQERLQVIICGILVGATMLGAIAAHPSLTEIIKGIFYVGYVPDAPAWVLQNDDFAARPRLLEIATTFGYIGGSMASYAIYASWTGIHGWGMSGSPAIEQIRATAKMSKKPDYLPVEPEEVKKGLLHLLTLKYDVLIGLGVLLLVSWSFMIAGAAVMNPNELLPLDYDMLSKQKAIWEQVSPLLVPVYYVAILVALWGTLYAIPEINIRLSHDFGGVILPVIKKIPYKKFSLYLGIYLIAGAMFILITGLKPVRIMDTAAMLSTNIGNTVLIALGLWLNMILPKQYRPGIFTIIMAVIAFIILAFSAYLSVVYY